MMERLISLVAAEVLTRILLQVTNTRESMLSLSILPRCQGDQKVLAA